MSLPIYVYGSDVLREVAKEIDTNSEETRKEIDALIVKMVDTMENADGVGLAAPQIGRSIRMVIVDGTPLAEDLEEMVDFKRIMINPVVLEESEDTAEYSEGCLSVPDINANIVRPSKIKVRYINEKYQEVTEEFSGFGCRIVQHELDHLDGVLFVDRATPIRKKMIQGKLTNISNGKARTHYKIVRK